MSWILEEIIEDSDCWYPRYLEFKTKEDAEQYGANNFLSGKTKHYEVYHS